MATSKLLGRKISGKYLVESVIGEGGMGIVVAARHLDLDQMVAIKVLRENVFDGAEARARFIREARTLARLQSEHVVRLYDLGRLDDDSPYMVMEFLRGSDLEQVSRKQGQMPVKRAVQYVLEAAEGLAEAHVAGMVHRDLKLGNLFVNERTDGRTVIKLLDFGIAKSLLKSSKLTRDSLVLGSPGYMSPEQLQSTKFVDARTDIWALGVILYRLLTREYPFERGNLAATIDAVTSGRPKPIAEIRDDVPDGLVEALGQLLKPDLVERCPTVLKLAELLAPYGDDNADRLVKRIAKMFDDGPPPLMPAGTRPSAGKVDEISTVAELASTRPAGAAASEMAETEKDVARTAPATKFHVLSETQPQGVVNAQASGPDTEDAPSTTPDSQPPPPSAPADSTRQLFPGDALPAKRTDSTPPESAQFSTVPSSDDPASFGKIVRPSFATTLPSDAPDERLSFDPAALDPPAPKSKPPESSPPSEPPPPSAAPSEPAPEMRVSGVHARAIAGDRPGPAPTPQSPLLAVVAIIAFAIGAGLMYLIR